MQNEQKKEVKEILYIKKQDLYNFNLYLASLNKNYGTLLVATFVIFLGVYGIITGPKEDLVMNILFCAFGVFGYVYVLLLMKFVIRNKINKLKIEDLEPVELTINEDGVLYKFADEKNNEGKEFYPFSWKEISRAVVVDDYIYLHMIDHRTVILITRKDLRNNDTIQYLQLKLEPMKRFFDKRKASK